MIVTLVPGGTWNTAEGTDQEALLATLADAMQKGGVVRVAVVAQGAPATLVLKGGRLVSAFVGHQAPTTFKSGLLHVTGDAETPVPDGDTPEGWKVPVERLEEITDLVGTAFEQGTVARVEIPGGTVLVNGATAAAALVTGTVPVADRSGS